jgi:hypothetical protein
MKEPDLLAEIRSVRDELARRFGDAWGLSQAMVEQSRISGRVVVRLPSRKPQPPRVERPAAMPAPKTEAEPGAAVSSSPA